MKKTCFQMLLFMMTFLMMALALTGCGNSGETLYIELEDYYETEDGLEIVLATENDTGYPVSLGWAGGGEIEVTTDEGTYYYEPFMTEIPRGEDELVFTIQEAEGEIEKIVMNDLKRLNSSGLPGRQLKKAVVYDERAGVDSFSKSFGFFTSTTTVMFTAMGVIMAAFFVVIIIVLVRTQKKNRQASRAFNPFGGVMNNDGNLNMDFHRMHDDAHQRFVQQETIRQHTDFAQKSVTFTDQGGFIPPPPPPPPPPPFGF